MKKHPKQIIIVRNDLNMDRGKSGAQIAHASMACILDQMGDSENKKILILDGAIKDWLEGRFIKIVVGCDDLEHLFEIRDKLEEKGILYSLIKDAGLTVFKEPTITCLGIGPCYPEDIDEITRTLKLYK